MADKRVLMVEGTDDEHVVKSICGQYQLGTIHTIRRCEGKDALIEAISVRIKESDINSLGIILDADKDIQASWQSVFEKLKSAGYTDLPKFPDPAGTLVLPPHNTLLPKVGIWLMPDNQLPGILEDFLAFLVPMGDSLLEHARSSIENMPEQPRFSKPKAPKALIHTWLAWQEEPGKPLGQAMTARYLDHSLPLGRVFAGWLQKTFFS